jgi:hypothetical protein
MSKPQVAPGAARAVIESRRARILAVVDHARVVRGNGPAGDAERRAFFRREAEELYWNELAWEQMTDEEAISGGHLTELVFPGFLALIDGLLARGGSNSERRSGIRAHPDAVEDILAFLGERAAELTAELRSGADSQKVVWARSMTLRLIDLVLYRLHEVGTDDQELLEGGEDG